MLTLEPAIRQESSGGGFLFPFPFPERSGQTGLACNGMGEKAILPEEEEMPPSVANHKH